MGGKTGEGEQSGSERINRPYLFATTCGASFLISSCALTFRIWPACSLSCAVTTLMSFLSSLMVASCFAALDLSCAIVACCSSIFLCSLSQCANGVGPGLVPEFLEIYEAIWRSCLTEDRSEDEKGAA